MKERVTLIERMYLLSEELTKIALHSYASYIITYLYVSYLTIEQVFTTFGTGTFLDKLLIPFILLLYFMVVLVPLLLINQAHFFGKFWAYPFFIIVVHFAVAFILMAYFFPAVMENASSIHIPSELAIVLYGLTPGLLLISGSIRLILYIIRRRKSLFK